MAEVRIKDIDEHEIDTILAEDIDFEGHLTFKKPLMIKGRFKGDIRSTSALYIGEKAFVEATTEAGVISSRGKHKGNIVAHARVELYSTAQVDGDITTPDLVVESGCKFNGTCSMGGGQKKEHPAAAPAHPGAQQGHAPQASGPAAQHVAQPSPGQPGQPGGGQHPAGPQPRPGAAPGGQGTPQK